MEPLARVYELRPIDGRSKSRMFSALLGGVVLGASTLSGCTGEPAATRGGPISTVGGLSCSDPIWDLGEVLVKGKSISFDHSFRLDNRSGKTIKLQEVRTDCGCLVAKGYATEIGPSRATEINVTISVFGPPGNFRKTILLKDEMGATLPLNVIGSRAISNLLYTSPTTINFGSMTPNESKTKHLVVSRYNGNLVNFRGLDAKDRRIHLGGQWTSYTMIDALKMNINCVDVPIRLDLKSEPVGSYKSKVTLITDSEDASTTSVEIEVEAEIIEEKTPWIQSILIHRLEAGESVDRPLMDQHPQATGSTQIVSSFHYSGDQSIQVEVIQSNANSTSTFYPVVRISRKADYRAGGLARGTLTIHFGGMDRKIDIAVFLPR